MSHQAGPAGTAPAGSSSRSPATRLGRCCWTARGRRRRPAPHAAAVPVRDRRHDDGSAPVMSRFSAVVRFASSSPGRSPAYVSRSVRGHCQFGRDRPGVGQGHVLFRRQVRAPGHPAVRHPPEQVVRPLAECERHDARFEVEVRSGIDVALEAEHSGVARSGGFRVDQGSDGGADASRRRSGRRRSRCSRRRTSL